MDNLEHGTFSSSSIEEDTTRYLEVYSCWFQVYRQNCTTTTTVNFGTNTSKKTYIFGLFSLLSLIFLCTLVLRNHQSIFCLYRFILGVSYKQNLKICDLNTCTSFSHPRRMFKFTHVRAVLLHYCLLSYESLLCRCSSFYLSI